MLPFGLSCVCHLVNNHIQFNISIWISKIQILSLWQKFNTIYVIQKSCFRNTISILHNSYKLWILYIISLKQQKFKSIIRLDIFKAKKINSVHVIHKSCLRNMISILHISLNVRVSIFCYFLRVSFNSYQFQQNYPSRRKLRRSTHSFHMNGKFYHKFN